MNGLFYSMGIKIPFPCFNFVLIFVRKQQQMRYYLVLAIFGLIWACSEPKQKQPKVQDLETLLKLYPDSVELLVKQGNTFLDAYEGAEAFHLGARAFRLDSNNIDARFLYANALINIPKRNTADVAIAQRHFLYIIKKQPENKKAFISLASTYFQQGEFDKSFKYINDVLRKDPRYRDAYIMKGTNYLALGKRDLAKSSYETAVQQDSKFFEGYLALAYLYSEDKEPIALEYFRTAVTLRPQSVDALYGVAYTLQEQGKYEEALAAYRQLISVDPKFHLALFNEAYIKQFYQNDIDSAIYFYSSAIDLEPEFVKGWHNLGLCYVAKKDRTNALKCFAKALKYNPDFELSRIEADKLR